MRSFVPIVLSLILGTALSHELVTPLEKDEQQDHQLRRQLCTPSASTDKTNYGVGEDIRVTLNICQASVEWFGIWQVGTSPGSSNSVNWQYTTGGQSNNGAQSAGGYIYAMNGNTEGSSSWPLVGNYQVYYLSSRGPVIGPQFSIGGGSSPVAPAPSPVAIPTAPAPTPASNPGSCNPSIQVDASCYNPGSQITATFVTCGAGVEWLGIYYAGAAVTSPARNWQYACVGQSCASPQSAGAYRYGFGAGTTGASSWPLSSGTYQIYFHSSVGTLVSSTFTISSNCNSASGSGTTRPLFRALWAPEEQEN